jgi:O-antigen ligase
MSLLTTLIFLRHAQLGFSFASVNKAVSPFFRNHVNYSAMLVCVLPLVVCVSYGSVGLKRLAFVLGGFLLVAAFFSYARGAWLAVLTGGLAYWLIEKRRLVITFVICIVAIMTFSWWLATNNRYLRYANHYQATIFHTDFTQHLIATYRLKDLSTAERFNRWTAAARMVPDAGLSGFGPNTFYPLYKRYQIPAFRTWVSNNPEHSTVHNYFLMVLVEQGVVGLAIWVTLCGCLLYYSQRLYHRLQDPVSRRIAAACGVIVVMIVTVNCLSDLMETDKIGSLFLLCLSALVAIDSNNKDRTHSNSPADVERIP